MSSRHGVVVSMFRATNRMYSILYLGNFLNKCFGGYVIKILRSTVLTFVQKVLFSSPKARQITLF